MRLIRAIAVAGAVLGAAGATQAWEPSTEVGARTATTLAPIEVIAPTPLAGAGIDPDKIAGSVQTLTSPDIERTGSPLITDALFQRVPAATLSDPNGNSADQALAYRGFSASPLQGTPPGIAVYLNGVRFNQAFGDTVDWDLIPTNAVERSDLWTDNPAFGLNAIGGAVNLQMKDGFGFRGFRSEAEGGSFGHADAGMQYGAQSGNFAAYVAAQGSHDEGWRRKSPAQLGRAYGDLGWKNDGAEFHLFGLAASSSFGVAAATPVQLLDLDRGAIFTTPQKTENTMALLGFKGSYAVSDAWSLQGGFYVRGFRQRHIDGNAADTERCSNGADAVFVNHLCLQDDGFPRPDPVTAGFRDEFAILDQNNNPIPCPPGAGNTCNATPYGTVDRTSDKAATAGASVQAVGSGPLFGHGNHFTAGASLDASASDFAASSELGVIDPALVVVTDIGVPGAGATIHTLGGLGYAPIGVRARNTYYGIYALDTLDIDDRLSATAGWRLNIAAVSVGDRRGTSPEVSSRQTYTHLNPIAGFAYKITDALTGYFGFSQANRVPTPLEQSCSSPAKPCLLEDFLVADPPLQQVVANTYETGLRETLPLANGRLAWKAALYRTDSFDDIVNVASVVQGRGFFQNVPATRRQGVEGSIEYRAGQWLAYAGYSLVDASYRFAGALPSPNNPMAGADGNVPVIPGRRIPGIPLNQGKLGFDFLPNPELTLGGDVQIVGSSYFVGDDANQNPRLPGYWIANLHGSYRLSPHAELYVRLNNLFDKRYALYGTYFNLGSVANVALPAALSDSRTEVPGAPFSIFGGVRLTF
ncbi:MAG: TonB-dependent receptor [Alphaproteobacteria bacterium]|nr:TonB-dependent receptor [Alphaproteobacteria bacterium]